MEKAKSAVWAFFKTCKDDERKAECTLCSEETVPSLKRIVRGKTPRSFSTKPLWNHLEGKHPKYFQDAKKSTNERCVDESVGDPLSPSLSNISAVKEGVTQTQSTLGVTLKKKRMWSLDDSRSKNITQKIAEMMALDAEPFSLVDREGFNRLIKHLAPQYPLPNGRYFSQKVMPEMYAKLQSKIREKLSTVEFISFTTDIWTCSTNNESFISLTANCLTSEHPELMKREIFVLGVKHFPMSHTGSDIAEVVSCALEEWDISSEQVHLIVTDNAADMIDGTNLMRVKQIGCFIHSVQLVIYDAIFLQKNIVDILTKCREIVTHFSHSALACTKLKEIQANLSLPNQKLTQDVATRWNSTFHMISRLHEQKQAVTAYAAEYDIPTLTAHQWNAIGNIIHTLKPFDEMTKQASADNETIAYVIPAIATLNSYLMKRQKDSGIQTLKAELQKSLNKRFLSSTGLNVLEKQCFVVATLLDPRYKTRFLQDIDKAMNWVIDELIAADNKSIADVPVKKENEERSLSPEDQPCSSLEEAHEDIWKCFEEIANGSKSDIDNSLESNDSSGGMNPKDLQRQPSDGSEKRAAIYKLELEKYLTLPLLPRQEDPLMWWRQHATQYPNIKKLVIKYLSPPASSVNSGRLFSAAGSIYTENRNKLSPENAERLLFIMKNMKIVNFIY